MGSPFVFCLRTSKWELSKLPTCKVVKCSSLKTPANGRMQLTKISFNGRAKFTCDDGFNLIGEDTLTCLASGSWSSEVPTCKSIYECPALDSPMNGALIYASDSGVIEDKLEAYSIGTFAEIKCDEGFEIDGENLISCTEQGVWDFDVEDCREIETTTVSIPTKVPVEFWREFKEFLFHSCNSTNPESRPKLCNFYKSDFESDISSFELPETPEFEGMDGKVSKLLTDLIEAENFPTLDVENFMKRMLRSSHVSDSTRDSYRFVICLYIDLIIIHMEIDEVAPEEDEKPTDNINQKIMKMLKKIALQAYKNQILKA